MDEMARQEAEVEKKTPRQPRHELFFLLLLFSSFSFVEAEKGEIFLI